MQIIPENISVVQAIQLILAPGIMINACGLLMLGIGNKFSTVLNRIRVLNEEKRKLMVRAGEPNFTPLENQRLESVSRQISGLMYRAQLIRNAIFCYFTGIGFFVITSFLIGAEYFFHIALLRLVILFVFLLGMLLVFGGVLYGVFDTLRSFDIVKFEVQVDE